jgi:hypothetical protein
MTLSTFQAAAFVVFVAMAGFGMAIATMGVALLMSLLGERSHWFRIPSPLRFFLRMVLALVCTTVFGLVMLVAYLQNRDAIVEPVVFTVVFVCTAVALYLLYPRVSPELVGALRRHFSNGSSRPR